MVRRDVCARVCRFIGAKDVVRAFGSDPMVGMGQQVSFTCTVGLFYVYRRSLLPMVVGMDQRVSFTFY
jgi:hypothetical protein